MERPSSTSSSSGSRWWIPWGGLLALAAIVLLDRIFFGVIAPWGVLAERVRPTARPYHQVAQSWGTIRELSAVADRPKVFVMGSSRANCAFNPQAAKKLLPEIAFGRVAFAALRPFEMRSLSDELIGAGADAVVLVLSEFDTHRPIRLDPMPGTSAASVSALAELFALGGPGFAFENRTLLYRIPLSRVLDAYRFREILRRAGLDAIRTFPLDKERHSRRRARALTAAGMGGGKKIEAPDEVIDRIVAGFPESRGRTVRFQIWMLAQMGAGEHVRVQKQLIRSTAARLRRAGLEVVVAEGPLHPDAALLYDPRLRDDFLAFADTLRAELGVRLLPLETFGEFSPSEFGDMLHLNVGGARHFTRVLVREVGPLLGVDRPRRRAD